MEIILNEKKINSVIKSLHYSSVNDLLKDNLITEILFKISDFKTQINYFRNKYSLNFSKFKKEYNNNKEDYNKWDDLMAWEFATQAYKHWNEQLNTIKDVL